MSEQVDPKTLKLADYNPRTMDAQEFADLKLSIKEEGFLLPVIANSLNGRIIGGHQRVRAAIELGLTEIPVIWVERDEKGERLLNVRLNHIEGRDDPELLAALLRLMEDETRMKTGLAAEEIAKLLDAGVANAVKEFKTSDFGPQITAVCPSCGYVIKQ